MKKHFTIGANKMNHNYVFICINYNSFCDVIHGFKHGRKRVH